MLGRVAQGSGLVLLHGKWSLARLQILWDLMAVP